MRKGESIFKRKDGRYEGRYIKEYKNNKAIYGYVYAKTYSECKIKKNKMILEFKNKKQIKINKTLNNLIEIWLNNKSNIKESTYTKYYNVYTKHIKNEIGRLNIKKINEKTVNDYLNNKLKTKSKNTVYSICNILKQVFKDNNININFIKIKLSTGKGKSLYINEKIELENKLININNNISIGILLSLFLGLRESEVCGLKYSDIDIDNKVICINNIVSRVKSFDTKNKTKLIISTPKTTNSKRVLPIPEKLINILKNLKYKSNDNNYLLTNKNKYMDPRTFYNHYKKFLKELNINYTYHDLRHTFATNCIELGIDYKSLMELLGHSNISTTMNIYVHPSLNNKRNFVNLL